MLSSMAEKREFRTADEAVDAFGRANQTQTAVVALLDELKRPGITQRERADKELEIDRLRQQRKQEMEPVKVFYKELVRKAEEKLG